MKKSRIGIIIILMSTALVGIILVQAYWIHNTITQKEKIFSYQVSEALSKVAERSEKHWIAAMIQKQMSNPAFDSIYSVKAVKNLSAENVLDDSVIALIARTTTTGIFYGNSTGISGSSSAANDFGMIPNRPTMILEPMELSRNISADPMAPGIDLASHILGEIDKQFQLNADKLYEVMQQMMIEMMNQGITPEEKIDSAFINKSLNEEFAARGIETDFQ
ncbi:MAG: hypothetical protein ACK4IY_05345, partial [Chitinophagales bacterium]